MIEGLGHGVWAKRSELEYVATKLSILGNGFDFCTVGSVWNFQIRGGYKSAIFLGHKANRHKLRALVKKK